MFDDTKNLQVRGDAVAVTGGAANVAVVNLFAELTLVAFQDIPKKQKLTITDIIYYPQGDVTGPYTVNLAEQFPNGANRILSQLDVAPGHATQSHHHTGHVFGPESRLIVYTDANGPANKHISVTVIGYLGLIPKLKRPN